MSWEFMVGDKVTYKDKKGKEKMGTVTGYDESMLMCPMIVQCDETKNSFLFTPDGKRTPFDYEPTVVKVKSK